jgi:hypothetical protein
MAVSAEEGEHLIPGMKTCPSYKSIDKERDYIEKYLCL